MMTNKGPGDLWHESDYRDFDRLVADLPLCCHCGEEFTGDGYDVNGEVACSMTCAMECLCMCVREQETPFAWQVMESCALGLRHGPGVRYATHDTVAQTLARSAS